MALCERALLLKLLEPPEFQSEHIQHDSSGVLAERRGFRTGRQAYAIHDFRIPRYLVRATVVCRDDREHSALRKVDIAREIASRCNRCGGNACRLQPLANHGLVLRSRPFLERSVQLSAATKPAVGGGKARGSRER